MYYELYIDIFFFVNFMMDICILLLSKKILKCPATYGSVLTGAASGAFLTCIVVILPVKYSFVKLMIFHGPIIYLMIKTGLRIRNKKRFVKAYITVYISSVLIGGIFSSLRQYMLEGSFFFAFAIISYMISYGIWRSVICMGRYRNNHCEVLLLNGEKQIKVYAIIDTGNWLKDSVTGKPVSIISAKIAKELWHEFPEKGVRYIPYHTIGKKERVLPLLVLEKMCLYLEEEVWITQGLVAVSEETDLEDMYGMILNPDVR